MIPFYPTASEKSRKNGDSVIILRDFFRKNRQKNTAFPAVRAAVLFFGKDRRQRCQKEISENMGGFPIPPYFLQDNRYSIFDNVIICLDKPDLVRYNKI